MAELRAGFRAESARIAAEARAELGLDSHARLVPERLAEHLAIPVVPLDEFVDERPEAVRHLASTEGDQFSAATVFRGSARVIVVNSAHADTRRASSVAHEIAHVLLEHEPDQERDARPADQERDARPTGKRPTGRPGAARSSDRGHARVWSGAMEAEADWLSGELLVPREAALAAARAGIPLTLFAARFGVSADMARWRVDATGAARQASLERWRRRVSRATARRPAARTLSEHARGLVGHLPSDVWLSLLDEYSRSVDAGNEPGARLEAALVEWATRALGRGPVPALAAPPAVVAWARKRLSESDPVVRYPKTLVEYTPSKRPTRKAFEELAATLEAHRIGIEPDARRTTSAPASWRRVVLYSLPAADPQDDGDRTRYVTARAVLQAAAGGAPHPSVVRPLVARLAEELQLSGSERAALNALQVWLATRSAKAPSRFEVALPSGAMVELTTSFLSRFAPYPAVLGDGLAEAVGSVRSLIARESPARAGHDRPVTVIDRRRVANGRRIPPPPAVREVTLDLERVRAKLEESERVHALLEPIFAAEPDAGPAQVPGPLDPPHAALLARLAARTAWPRAEIEAIAAELGLLASGALDTINDAAVEACGEPACEGDDPILVDAAIAGRIAGDRERAPGMSDTRDRERAPA